MIVYYLISCIVIAILVNFSFKKYITGLLANLFLVLQTAFSVYAFIHLNSTEFKYFTFDAPGFLFLLVMNILSIATVYHGFVYLKNETKGKYNLYHCALLILITAITGAYLANDLTVAWIFVEATTLAASVLIYHQRDEHALEATWKYIFICSTGIALAYIGILLLSISLHSGKVFNLSFTTLSTAVKTANPLYLKMAFLMVLVGYSTKMELFPMHTAGIDANTVAPSPISAFISTAIVNLGFLSIFRVYSILTKTPIFSWMNNVLLIAGICSLIFATAYLLQAKNLKRMLAYSTLENAGIVAIALSVGGIGYYAAFLHLLLHSFVKSGLFFQSGQVFQVYRTFEIKKMGQYMRLNPNGSLILLATFVMLLAIPPSGLFISEFMTLKALFLAGNYKIFLGIVFLICFVIYAISRNMLQILYAPCDTVKEPLAIRGKITQNVVQVALLIIVICFCFWQPGLISDIINLSIQDLPK